MWCQQGSQLSKKTPWNGVHNWIRNVRGMESVQVRIDSWFNCLTNWEIFYCPNGEPPRCSIICSIWHSVNLMTWFARLMRCGWLASTGGHNEVRYGAEVGTEAGKLRDPQTGEYVQQRGQHPDQHPHRLIGDNDSPYMHRALSSRNKKKKNLKFHAELINRGGY